MITERELIELVNRLTRVNGISKVKDWQKGVLNLARDMGIIEPLTAKERYFQKKMEIAADIITKPKQYVYTAEVNRLCDLADAAIKEAEEQNNANKIGKEESDEEGPGAKGALFFLIEHCPGISDETRARMIMLVNASIYQAIGDDDDE